MSILEILPRFRLKTIFILAYENYTLSVVPLPYISSIILSAFLPLYLLYFIQPANYLIPSSIFALDLFSPFSIFVFLYRPLYSAYIFYSPRYPNIRLPLPVFVVYVLTMFGVYFLPPRFPKIRICSNMFLTPTFVSSSLVFGLYLIPVYVPTCSFQQYSSPPPPCSAYYFYPYMFQHVRYPNIRFPLPYEGEGYVLGVCVHVLTRSFPQQLRAAHDIHVPTCSFPQQ